MAILKIALIAVTLVTAVACATRNVRSGDLELAATKGKRHISPVHYLQPYAGTGLQYHRPSVIVDSGDYYAESDKGNGGYIVFTHEKGKGYKTKGKGAKGKGGGYGYVSDGNGDDGSSESDGHGGYGGKIKIKGKGYYGKGKGYGSSKGKGKGSSYGKGKGYSYGSKGKGKGGSYGKGKGGHYGKGKGYGSKGKGNSYGKGKGGIPYGSSGGYSSYGIGGSDGGGGSSESHGQGISHLYGTVIGTSYGSIGTSYGSVGTSYGTVGNSYGISGVSYSSHGSNGGSSSEFNGQPDSYGISDGGTENSAGNAGGNESENSGIGENISVGSIKEGNSADSAINADEASVGVENIGENPSEVAVTAGDTADGGSESGSAVVDGGVESGINSSPVVSESGSGDAAETGGKKRSTSQTSENIEEIKSSDSDVNKKAGNPPPPASSVTITGGSGPSGKTVYNVAIKGGASSTSNENGNNTFRLDFQTDGAGSGEKAFTVSVHFTSGNEKVDTLPDVIPTGSRALENKSVNDEIPSGGKRSIPSAFNKESAKEPEGSAIRTTSSNNTGKSANSSSSGTRSNDDQRAITKGEIRSPTTTLPPPPSERNNREKSDTAVDKGGDFNTPSPRNESMVSSSSTGKVERSNKGSENNDDKGRVAKEISSNTGRNSGVLNKGSSIGTETLRQRPAKGNQTSERVETADNKDSPVNRTRHNNPRTRPPSKPVTNENDSNPLILKSLADTGNGGRGQRDSRDKQPTGLNGQLNAQKPSVGTLPRNNHPIAITTEGSTHLFFSDAAIVGKDKEEFLIKLPKVEIDHQEKGKRTAVKDVSSGDSVVVPPLVVPYLPVDTYYIPLRRLTRGQKKPVVT